MRELQAGTVDAAIVYAPDPENPPAALIGEPLAQLPVSIVESRRRPRTRGAMQLAQLNTQRWVMNPEGCCFRTILSKMLDPRRTSMQMILEVSGFKRQLSVVAQGRGLRFVPEPVLQRSPLSSRLRVVPFADTQIPVLGCVELVVFKAFFSRTKDWADIEGMLEAGAVDTTRALGWLVRLLGADHPSTKRLADLTAGE